MSRPTSHPNTEPGPAPGQEHVPVRPGEEQQ